MPRVGATARSVYIGAARIARRVAARSGFLRALDARYDKNRTGPVRHLRTLFAIHDVDDLVRLDVPWWTYPAISAVDAHLARLGGRARAFEYGSGASTVWLARRCASVHSVEHDAAFAAVVAGLLDTTAGLGEVTYEQVAAVRSATPTVASGRRGEEGLDYADYRAAITRAGGTYDLICIDGRARMACLEAALPHLAPGGLILVDDAQRPRYREGMARSGLAVHRCWGWVPTLPYPRQTALLSVPQPVTPTTPGAA